MEFQRARTKEQKNVRVSEIVEAAIKQYNQMPYEDITFASISKELPFSRVNLYKYFKTKEEIFLKIAEIDMYKSADKLKLVFAGQPAKDTDAFAKKLASLFKNQGRMLELCSRLLSVQKLNASPQSLGEFFAAWHNMHDELEHTLKEQLTFLSNRKIRSLSDVFFTYAMGLYPMSLSSPHKEKAAKLAGRRYKPVDFADALADFVVVYVK